MDLLPNEQNFDLDKSRQSFQHRDHPDTIEKINIATVRKRTNVRSIAHA